MHVFLLSVFFISTSLANYHTIYLDNTIVPWKDESGIAWSSSFQNMETEGWDKIMIETNKEYEDETQMYSAGYLEGYLARTAIHNFYTNFLQDNFADDENTLSNVYQWLAQQNAWTNQQIGKHQYQDTEMGKYWRYVNLFMTQLRGMADGYNNYQTSEKQLSLLDFIFLNSNGDISEDLMYALNSTDEDDNWMNLSYAEVSAKLAWSGHCSVLIKLTEDNLYAAHSTWGSYSTMLRTYKIYTFNLKESSRCKQVAFSSYPGFISSVDDFYMCDGGLFVTETTNTIIDETLYDLLTTSSLLSWQRALVANRLATTGQEWTWLFSQYNSGTYNNQWMILDYDLYEQEKMVEDLLWIVEVMPNAYFAYEESRNSLTLSADVTSTLVGTGMWSSFNRPYFPQVFNAMGYDYYTEEYGDDFSYTDNPRALIFQRDGPDVKSLDDMKRIMNYNDWQNDPLSQNNSGNAISARFDLVPEDFEDPVDWLTRGAHGGIDSKITSFDMFQNMECISISGPTHDQQPVFEFSNGWHGVPHKGMPNRYDFDWITVSPDQFELEARL